MDNNNELKLKGMVKFMSKMLKYGMVGGGQGAFIGAAHRRAIGLDGKASLAAGCFSRSYSNTLITGEELGLEKTRLYRTYEEMAQAEASREDGIDFAVIVTPNYAHYGACKAFLEAGIHVSCDKPLTVSLEQALELEKLAKQKKLQFMVTYAYS
ncbi:MAG: Gfo/Idh/MocA family protein, partial [Ruminiclostridium sp.]